MEASWPLGYNSLTAGPVASEIAADSKEEFITEHYWGYTQLANGKTSQYQVEHPRWEMYPIRGYEVKVRFDELYGRKFGVLNNVQPDSVMLAEGSKVSIRMFDKIT